MPAARLLWFRAGAAGASRWPVYLADPGSYPELERAPAFVYVTPRWVAIAATLEPLRRLQVAVRVLAELGVDAVVAAWRAEEPAGFEALRRRARSAY